MTRARTEPLPTNEAFAHAVERFFDDTDLNGVNKLLTQETAVNEAIRHIAMLANTNIETRRDLNRARVLAVYHLGLYLDWHEVI